MREGQNGLLVPPRDAGALADAIERLARDRGLLERLRAAAHATAQDALMATDRRRHAELLRVGAGGPRPTLCVPCRQVRLQHPSPPSWCRRRDRPADLERLLRALAGQRTEHSFEVVVVDDGSEPPIDSSQLGRLAEGRLLRRHGGGPAAARNAGAAAARGALLLFTDDDTEPAPGVGRRRMRLPRAQPAHVGVEGPVTSPPFDPLYEHSLENHAPGAYWTCNVAYRATGLRAAPRLPRGLPRSPLRGPRPGLPRRARLGPIGFAPGMGVTHFPRPLSLRRWIGRARLTRSEALLAQRHPERFGRSARVPARVFPILNALYSWARQFRAQAPQLLRSPRRLARFALVASLYLGTVILTAIVPGGRGSLPQRRS